MAKTRKAADAPLTVQFLRTGNPWLDAGIVGLYRVLNRLPAYVDEVAEPADDGRKPAFPDVKADTLLADRLILTGPTDQVHACLVSAYDRLVATYFNISSKKQREDRGGYNFYYDSVSDRFVLFPKKKAAGAASLLFDKAARFTVAQVDWEAGADGKKEPGRLPPSHAHLQSRLDEFLAMEEVKPGPPAGLLIDGPNQVRPNVEIRSDASGEKATCFLAGDPATALVEAKETAFPLLGGSRSFISGNARWPRLGWKTDFAGKFVPALAFFYRQGDDLHLFFPQSNDLRRVNASAETLAGMVQLEPNLFRNFDFAPGLGGYFTKRSEVALAFLHRVFVKLTDQQRAERARQEEARPADAEKTPLFDDEPVEAEPEPLVSAADVFDATQRDGPVGFVVISATKKGQVWMARDFWTYQDVVYLARLFARMQRPVRWKAGRVFYECQPGSLLRALVDFEAKDESRTLLRDRVCESILRRQPVLHLIERHAFHANSHADPGKSRKVKSLLDFARLYETELRRGTPMDDAYQAMVKTSTWLGDTIGKAVADAVVDRRRSESRGQARGALFRLRKTRTTSDFMNELARLQFRYEINVPRDILDGQTFTPETFEEFRGFCVVAALNRFLFGTRESNPTPSQAE